MTRLDTPFYTPLASGALQQLSETLWHQLCVRYPVPDVLGYILLQQLMVALWQARELGLEQAGQFAQQADPTSRPMLVLSRERRAECRHIAQLRRTLTEDTPPPPRTSNPEQKQSKTANTPAPEMSKPAHTSATAAQENRNLSNTSLRIAVQADPVRQKRDPSNDQSKKSNLAYTTRLPEGRFTMSRENKRTNPNSSAARSQIFPERTQNPFIPGN